MNITLRFWDRRAADLIKGLDRPWDSKFELFVCLYPSCSSRPSQKKHLLAEIRQWLIVYWMPNPGRETKPPCCTVSFSLSFSTEIMVSRSLHGRYTVLLFFFFFFFLPRTVPTSPVSCSTTETLGRGNGRPPAAGSNGYNHHHRLTSWKRATHVGWDMINPEWASCLDFSRLLDSREQNSGQPGVASTVSSATKASLNPNMCSWRVNSESAGIAKGFLLTLES